MRNSSLVLAIAMAATLTGCQKSAEGPGAATAVPCAAPATGTADAADSPEALDLARKQALLDYAAMEDGFLNDPHAQWAGTATATSTFGETNSSGAAESNKPHNLVGKPDGKLWTNDRVDLGFDSIETTYEKPVHATAVRVVIIDGVAALNKVEVRDTDGAWSTAWTGISDVKREERGPRTWFVRTFDRTAKPVQAVRVTLANNVAKGYKVVDAVGLVGE